MTHAIITSSDKKYGDFLIDHWLRSLTENVDLRGIEVVVLDYGMNESQRSKLKDAGVILHPCNFDGNITNIRYRDMASYLETKNYDQVLAVDGGDIIFQTDIRPLFEQHKQTFRGVCEQRDIPFHDLILPKKDMDKQAYRQMFDFLENKPTVNGGVLFGPAHLFQQLWHEFKRHCHSFDVFGTDQLVMNYYVYRNGFNELDLKYNFAIVTSKTQFHIRNGVFFQPNGEPISIVHNAGMNSMTRCIRKFGYGKNRNKRKWLTPIVLHTSINVLNCYKRIRSKL